TSPTASPACVRGPRRPRRTIRSPWRSASSARSDGRHRAGACGPPRAALRHRQVSASPPPPPGPPGSKPPRPPSMPPRFGPQGPGPMTPEEKRLAAVKKVMEQVLQLARAAEPNLFGKEARDWFEKLDVAHENTVLVLQFALANDLPRGLALCAL